MELTDVTEIKVYYESPVPFELFKKAQWGNVVLPDSTFNFSLINEKLFIRGEQNTFYDTVYIWAQPVHVEAPQNGMLMSNAYKVQPNLIPFNKEIQLEIALENHHFPEHLSIYFYNEEKKTWHYMPSKFNFDSTYMQTNILSGEIFAIIKEEISPTLSSFIPQINGTYYPLPFLRSSHVDGAPVRFIHNVYLRDSNDNHSSRRWLYFATNKTWHVGNTRNMHNRHNQGWLLSGLYWRQAYQ